MTFQVRQASRSIITAAGVCLALTACEPPDPRPNVPSAAELEAIEMDQGLLAPTYPPGGDGERMRMTDRMENYHVPGVAIALIEGGEMRWSKAWGVTHQGGETLVASSTPFQIGELGDALEATVMTRIGSEAPADVLDLAAELFEPLDMSSSSSGPAPAESAGGHGPDGQPIAASTNGETLWSSVDDLAAWIIDLQKAHAGRPARRLDQDQAMAFLAPGRPADPEVGGSGHATWLRQSGAAPGYRVHLVGFFYSGHGAVVMTNADGGEPLIGEIVTGLARRYQWPDFQPLEAAASASAEVTVGQ